MELKKYKLRQLGEFKNGANYPKGSYGEGDKIVNVKDLFRGRFVDEKSLDELKPGSLKDKTIYQTQDGDILFTRSSLVRSGAGMCAMIHEPSQCILFCGFIIRYRLFNPKEVYPLYLLYLLRSPQYRNLFTGNQQTNITNINQDSLGEIEVALPIDLKGKIDNEKQVQIVSILDDLDNKIALNKRINAKLEQVAKRLYDYWFVQFDFPDKNGKPYKSSGGKMVWNEQLKREIPERWEVKPISEMLKCDIAGDWGEEEKKGNYNYKVNCVRGCDMIDMTSLPTRYILQANSKKLLQADDFIIEISGGSPIQSTGRIVQVTDEIINRFDKKVICSNFCHGIRIAEKDYISYFLQMWNMFYENKVFFNFEGKTSGLKNFQFDTFISQLWVFPPKQLSKQYHEIVSLNRKQIDKSESENQKLISLRDCLLPMLMNGQVEVR